MSRNPRLITLAGVAATVLAAAVSPSAAAAGAPPPLEPIEVERTLPTPAGVALGSATLAPGERSVVVEGEVDGAEQVGVMGLDGKEFRCLTCGLATQALDPDPLDDGRRILLTGVEPSKLDALLQRLGGGAGLGDLQFSVLECAPSIEDCADRRIVPLDFPRDGLVDGAQVREVSASPDGTLIKWNEVLATSGERMVIGRLVRTAKGYEARDPVILNEPFTVDNRTESWQAAGRFFESGGGASGRSFWDGGRTLKYNATSTALNYDLYELDLLTGARTRRTTDLDYNEMSDASPDGRWLSYASARGLDRMDVFTQLERPPFLDAVAFGALGRISLFSNRRCMNERWLMDREGQRGTYGGQPVVTEDGWVIRGWRWFEDGTRALITEERIPNEPEPRDPAARKRLRIIRFPERTPSAPVAPVHIDAADLRRIGAPYTSYHSMADRQVLGRVVRGRASGTATLTYLGSFTAGTWRVTYANYSDDGRSFVTGTESFASAVPSLLSTWSAGLVVRGAHQGHLRGTVTLLPGSKFRASVDSVVDGQRFERVPVQADCPGVRQAPLAVERLGGGRYRVTARVPEDPVARPVRGAIIEAGDARATTDADGVGVLDVPPAAATVRASAGGFHPAEGPA